jgi:sirohydrochlorin ferrochelatase
MIPRGASRLVTVAHGTRVTHGNEVAASITEQAARILGVPATTSYVELCEPLLADVMAERTSRSGAPDVVVPLLLSTGFHIKTDIPSAVADAHSILTRPLGPDPMLTAVMCRRLQESGAVPGSPVVMAAAGSNDPDAVPDLAEAERLLAAAWGGPVFTATVAGAGRPLADAIAEARGHGEVAVSTYLLSPGFFSRKAATIASEEGVLHVAGVLGDHARIVELVVRRYRAALAAAHLAA